MFTVKFTPYRAAFSAIASRQTSKRSMMSADGRYHFVIDPDLSEADFWIVQGKGIRRPEYCRVAPENTVMLTTEPQSVLSYPKSYLNQFGTVISCQENMHHRDLRLAPPVLPWFVGFERNSDGSFRTTLDYDALEAASTPSKTRFISVITSDKAFTRGHIERIRFVEKLKAAYGDQIDIFGSGFRPFGDKWEVLAPYKYHIVIENSSDPWYWTEKLGDCYLAETFPLYYGCKNITDFFPPEALCQIDINDFEKAKLIIDRAIESDLYERSRQLLRECRELMLNRFNMFDIMAKICDTLDSSLTKRDVILKPCRTMAHWRNIVNYTLTRPYYKLIMSLRGSSLTQ